MLGRVAELDAAHQRTGLVGRKGLVERTLGVSVEVVADQDDLLRLLYRASISRAQSTLVRRGRTVTSRQPASGSVNMNTLAVPQRSYS